jgi:exodeoxyribonuclease-1
MLEYTFYDNEATGLSKRHDQVTQFAGVTTDESFRVKNSINEFIRLLPYVVPHPVALAVTRKSPRDLCRPSLLSEYRAARKISSFLTPERRVTRVFGTFNGIRYDNEMLRTMFYRNLQEPYFNSSKDAINIDLLPVVRLVAAVCPGAIAIPHDDDGKPSFRLERLCPANGIELDAHDGFNDAIATMRLYQFIQEKAPWAIDIAMECGSGRWVDEMLSSTIQTGEPVFLFTSFGTPDFAPLTILASDGRRFIGADLRAETLAEDAGRIAEQLFKPDTPFQVVTSNKFPLVLSASRMRAIGQQGLTESLVERANEINNKPGFKGACKDAVSRNTVEKVNGMSSEDRIYDGFFDRSDKERMHAFNATTSWVERSRIPFMDPRLRDFSARIILDAVSTGEAVLPQEVIRSLALDCGEALCRPFGPPESSHTTIAKCLADGADETWTEWARERYGDHPVFDVAPRVMRAAPMAGQMTFGF